MLCFCFVFLCLVYPQVCPFLIAPSVLSNVYYLLFYNTCTIYEQFIQLVILVLWFLDTLFSWLYVRVGISLTCGKYLHNRIISLIWKMWAHKPSLIKTYIFILYWSANSNPGKWAVICMCVRGVDFDFSYDFVYLILELFCQCGIFLFLILLDVLVPFTDIFVLEEVCWHTNNTFYVKNNYRFIWW